MSEPLGKLHFWFTFAGVYCIFMPMHFLGIAGGIRRYADASGAAGVDFTRGNEPFKLRFASEVRGVASFEAWPTLYRSALALSSAALQRAARTLLSDTGLHRPVVDRVRAALRVTRMWRERGPEATARRAYEYWRQTRFIPIRLYVRARISTIETPALPASFAVYCADTVAGVLELAEVRNPAHSELLRVARGRLARGDRLWVGKTNGEMVAYVWERRTAPMHITENREIYQHFHTF